VLAAKMEGYPAAGIEIMSEYANVARERLAKANADSTE
jgi:DNA modification methylase